MKKYIEKNIVIEENIRRLFQLVPRYIPDKKVNTIVELGARDCLNTILLHDKYKKSKIYTFECNPATLDECKKRVKNIPEIELIEKAATNKNGLLTFYPIDQEKSEKTKWSNGNPGASSIFKVSKDYPEEKLIQKKITVPAIKLSTFLSQKKTNSVDLLFMDIQGGELLALKGLEEYLKSVKIIHTETNFVEFYKGQPLYGDLKKYLNDHGFIMYAISSFAGPFADTVFVNRKNTNESEIVLRVREYVLDLVYSIIMFNAYKLAKRFVFYKQTMKFIRSLYSFLKR